MTVAYPFHDCVFLIGNNYNYISRFFVKQTCVRHASALATNDDISGPLRDQGIVPRSLEVIFNSVGDRQYDSADLKPQLYCEVKRLASKEMLSAEKFKTMIINSAAVSLLNCVYSVLPNCRVGKNHGLFAKTE